MKYIHLERKCQTKEGWLTRQNVNWFFKPYVDAAEEELDPSSLLVLQLELDSYTPIICNNLSD